MSIQIPLSAATELRWVRARVGPAPRFSWLRWCRPSLLGMWEAHQDRLVQAFLDYKGFCVPVAAWLWSHAGRSARARILDAAASRGWVAATKWMVAHAGRARHRCQREAAEAAARAHQVDLALELVNGDRNPLVIERVLMAALNARCETVVVALKDRLDPRADWNMLLILAAYSGSEGVMRLFLPSANVASVRKSLGILRARSASDALNSVVAANAMDEILTPALVCPRRSRL